MRKNIPTPRASKIGLIIDTTHIFISRGYGVVKQLNFYGFK